jgi:2-keto-4-pentenoate hydratase/2-oxohepta-3-ene-1,7-dioic acid hydratase in catechol pathway
MLIARVSTAEGVRHVRAVGEKFQPIDDPYLALSEGREPADDGVIVQGELVAVVDPVVIVGIAQNGPAHRSPVQAWLKSPRTVIASGSAVSLRRDAGTAVAEGEIAVVIGSETTGLTAENAHEYVLGVTAVNDLSSPDRSQWDPRNFESKSGSGYTPIGTWIDTDAGIDDVRLTVEVDGDLVADTGSRELPVSIRECLAYVATWSPLGPGDVVMTGAPHSQAPVHAGQTVTIRVAGVELTTPLV